MTIHTEINFETAICEHPANHNLGEIAVPPIDEQLAIEYAIHGEIEKLDALSAEAERGIELLQERRTALISAAVTGKIDVRGIANTEARR